MSSSLLLTIFLIELAVQLVNTIGAKTINDLLWSFVLLFPTALSRGFAEQREKQQRYLAVRRELNATSSQDEFAKWAKLNRQHDKLLEDLKKTKQNLDGTRSKFDSYLTFARLVSTRAPQWFLPLWYSKTPMFWLPYGFFPYYVEWFVSFPRAPLGSVSIVMWQWACTTIITTTRDAVVAAVGLVRRQQRQQEKPVPAGNGNGNGNGNGKKEL